MTCCQRCGGGGLEVSSVPTIDEMQATYDMFSAAVDREDTLGATIYAAVCADHVAKLLKARPLITAAPDLLESLRELSSICGNRLPIGSFSEQQAKALAAIAKAEGK